MTTPRDAPRPETWMDRFDGWILHFESWVQWFNTWSQPKGSTEHSAEVDYREHVQREQEYEYDMDTNVWHPRRRPATRADAEGILSTEFVDAPRLVSPISSFYSCSSKSNVESLL